MQISLLIALSLIFTAEKIKQASYFTPAKKAPSQLLRAINIWRCRLFYKSICKQLSVVSLK